MSQVTVGQTINFTWGEQFCHSVTVVPMGLVTPNLMESNPNLSRPSGLNDTKPLSFDEPGVFLYYCEHHWPAGMVGVVFVTAP
ncbi:MAG: plastocyanin/azurin family copper-binding protein [Candidatus Binatia bacterium]